MAQEKDITALANAHRDRRRKPGRLWDAVWHTFTVLGLAGSTITAFTGSTWAALLTAVGAGGMAATTVYLVRQLTRR